MKICGSFVTFVNFCHDQFDYLMEFPLENCTILGGQNNVFFEYRICASWGCPGLVSLFSCSMYC